MTEMEIKHYLEFVLPGTKVHVEKLNNTDNCHILIADGTNYYDYALTYEQVVAADNLLWLQNIAEKWKAGVGPGTQENWGKIPLTTTQSKPIAKPKVPFRPQNMDELYAGPLPRLHEPLQEPVYDLKPPKKDLEYIKWTVDEIVQKFTSAIESESPLYKKIK